MLVSIKVVIFLLVIWGLTTCPVATILRLLIVGISWDCSVFLCKPFSNYMAVFNFLMSSFCLLSDTKCLSKFVTSSLGVGNPNFK
ncbi:hypothetical protein SLEP1_g2401 [Rubroshorea leprosula]|uniref:Secreted protein n=1 Tax=Rubroshorea leprosula TaxID=152421 RepID=A0AAV5HQT6_9ROSI|nr:hypothetical protein SLEP1_g2401 [Rubroshorea leprosula]